jgi:hypothetical protein
LIDASSVSHSSLFYQSALEAFPKLNPKEFGQVIISAFGSGLRILMPNQKLFCYPTLDPCFVPNSAFHLSIPGQISELLHYRSFRPPNILDAISFAQNVVGEFGRIVVFLSSCPSDFKPLNITDSSPITSSPNFGANWQQLQKTLMASHISVDILVNLPSLNAIDTVALSNFVEPLQGQLKVIDRSLYFKLADVLTTFWDSFPVSVELRLPLHFSGHRLKSSKFCQSKFMNLNSTSSAIVRIEFASFGPQTIPFQAIVRYRSLSGRSMIRVFSKRLLCSDNLIDVFSHSNESVLMKLIASATVEQFFSYPKGLTDFVINFLGPLFRGRNLTVGDSSPPLSNLPKYCLGLTKSFAFAFGALQAERVSYIRHLWYGTPSDILLSCYPQLWDVTDYLGDKGDPRLCPLKKVYLLAFKIFVLNDGVSTWIWVGKNLNADLSRTLFEDDEPSMVEDVEPNETDASRRLFRFVSGTVKLCIQDGTGHYAFLSRLVEDQTGVLPHTEAFMTILRRSIKSS